MYNYFDTRSGQKASLVADDVYEIIMKVLTHGYKLQNDSSALCSKYRVMTCQLSTLLIAMYFVTKLVLFRFFFFFFLNYFSILLL
jgi:hypothetical protein